MAHPSPLAPRKALPTTTSYVWKDRIPPAVLLLLAIGFEIMAHSFPPASGQVPIMIGWSMIALTIVDLLSRFNNKMGYNLTKWTAPAALSDKADKAEKNEAEPDPRRQITAVAAITGFSLALVYLGVMISVPIFALVAIGLGGRFGWLKTIISAVATSALIWLLFASLLRMQLFPGVLFGGS